ncbi:glycosyltransferase [Kineococcus sp. NPDC059986]|uniref:glycosyltransferase family 2 protein n=1 Tax=Kineococcus sp. NPDC059986 TaxID=3155538 RepID=UPI003450BBE3
MGTTVSLIIRTYDSVRTLGASIESIRAQTVPAHVIVVDSGSTDGTLHLAQRDADEVVQIRHQDFTYGHALNVGAAAARTPVHGALSSHAVLPRPDWLEIALSHIEAGAVAACGADSDPLHAPLTAPVRADARYLARHRYWGLTNTADVWDAAAWRREPFDEALVASEDQEWSWRAVAEGGWIVVDPALLVSGGHRRTAGMRAYHRRMVSEIRALEHVRPLQQYSVVDAVGDWVRREPRDPFISRARRLGRTRLLDAAARWDAGRRSAQGSPSTSRFANGREDERAGTR